MRFPPDQTLGVIRLKVHPPTEDGIGQAIRPAPSVRERCALLYLQNIDIAGRLAVVDEDKIRIRH